LAHPVEVDRALGALRQVLVEPARELVGTQRRHARRDQRARHQALRVREPVSPERERFDMARLSHRAAVPAIAVDRRVLVVSGREEPALTAGYLNAYRILV